MCSLCAMSVYFDSTFYVPQARGMTGDFTRGMPQTIEVTLVRLGLYSVTCSSCSVSVLCVQTKLGLG